MKKKQWVGMVLAVLVSVTGWVRGAVVEKPVALPGAMVCVTVSDLHGFIDGVGGIASQVSPMASGMMLKNMAGMQLGDPGLAGIAPGKGLAVVMLDQTNLFAVVEVSEAQAPAYTAALAQKGMQSKYVDGVLVVAKDAAQLNKGSGQLKAVKDTLLVKRSPDLQVVAQPADLIEKNKAEIDGMMQMMPMMMGMGMAQSSPGMDPASAQGMLRLLEGELRMFRSVAAQCETAAIVLSPKGGSIQLSETFVARPETRLAALMQSPSINQPNPKIQAGLLGGAAVAIDGTLSNPEALTTFIVDELDLLLKDMGLTADATANLKNCMQKWMGVYGGSFSETVDFGGDSFMNVAYVLEVKDEAKVMDLLKNLEKDAAPFLELYKSFGMPMSLKFKENVREYKGVNIHQFKIGLSMPQQQMANAASMNMNLSNMVYDVAMCDGLMLYTMGDTKVETLIDRVKDADFKSAPLKARSVYPASGFYYCDIDVAKYMSGISSVMPQDPSNPMPQLAALLQGADPVTSAGFREDGMVMWSINVPGSLLAKIGQAAMMMQMQQMQNMQQAPQPQPMMLDPASVPAPTPSP